jgi:hypothetical protein
MGFLPVPDLGRLVIFVNKRGLSTKEIVSNFLHIGSSQGLAQVQTHTPDVSATHVATSPWPTRLHLVATLRNGDVLKANGPLGLPYRANGTPASRVLDFQSRFGVASAFSRAIRQRGQPLDSTPSAALRNTGHGAEVTAQSPSKQHYLLRSRVRTLSRLLTRNHVVAKLSRRNMYRSLRANYCVALNHFVHPRSLVIYADACVPATPAYV